ncbi:response regulator [Halobacteriovorax sp. HLS]|uniref:response regulator n=1 Tax=Halobacteriovorax sp. HLS TaxID=2234000 RepID=UPI000FDAFA93|nr:response regulator [Halobacteriovorax sp. HLS]
MKVLLVDDMEEIIDLVSISLESFENIEIISAFSGNQARKILSRQRDNISLIISDYEMPDGDGRVVYNANRAIGIPFLFHSSSLRSNLKDFEFCESFATYFLDKPAAPKKLIKKVSSILDISLVTNTKYALINEYYIIKYFAIFESIYIKLSENHYTLVSRKSSPNKEYVLSLIKNKELTDFYIGPDCYINLLEEINNKNTDSVESLQDTVELISIYSNKLIGNEKENKIIRDKLDSSFKELGNQKNLKSFMTGAFRKGQYNLSHSILTFYLSAFMLKKKNLHDERTLYSFFIASLFHDSFSPKITSDLSLEEYIKIEKDHCTNDNLLKKLEPKAYSLIETHHNIQSSEFSRLSREEKIFASAQVLASESILRKEYTIKRIKSRIQQSSSLKELLSFIDDYF